MTELANIWQLIVKSNTFNFLIMITILALVLKKVNIIEMLEKMKAEVIAIIEKSQKDKSEAEDKYTIAKEKIKNIDSEIENQIALAKEQASNVAASIEESKNKKLKQLADNADKVVKAEEKNISIYLNDNTAIKAVNLAETNIRKRIQEDPSLHNKYIDECIEELEKAVL